MGWEALGAFGTLRGGAREEQLPAQRSPADQAGHRRSGAAGIRRGVGVGNPYTEWAWGTDVGTGLAFPTCVS